MKQASRSEHDTIDDDQDNDSIRSNFYRDPNSFFFHKNDRNTPHCNLLIIGDYFKLSNCSKKRELLSSDTKYEQLARHKNEADVSTFSMQDGYFLFVTESSFMGSCSHCYGFPLYSMATMIACIPNCAEDLKYCHSSLQGRLPKYGLVKHCRIVYVNMFNVGTEEYQLIEAKARELNFLNHKLVLTPKSIDELIKEAVQHSREVCNRLNQPVADPSEPQRTSESKCCVM